MDPRINQALESILKNASAPYRFRHTSRVEPVGDYEPPQGPETRSFEIPAQMIEVDGETVEYPAFTLTTSKFTKDTKVAKYALVTFGYRVELLGKGTKTEMLELWHRVGHLFPKRRGMNTMVRIVNRKHEVVESLQ